MIIIHVATLIILLAGEPGTLATAHEVTSNVVPVNFGHVLRDLNVFGDFTLGRVLNESVCVHNDAEFTTNQDEEINTEPVVSIEVPLAGLQTEVTAEDLNSSSQVVQMVSMLEYVSTPMTWRDANEYCSSIGATMATVRQSRQRPRSMNSLIRDYAESRGLAKDAGMWLGLHSHDHEVDFYSNWMQTEPDRPNEPNGVPEGNSDCVELNADKTWRDTWCYHEKPFLCAPLPCDDTAQFQCRRHLNGLDATVNRLCMSAQDAASGVCEERCTAFCRPGRMRVQSNPIDEWQCAASGSGADMWTPLHESSEVERGGILHCNKPQAHGVLNAHTL